MLQKRVLLGVLVLSAMCLVLGYGGPNLYAQDSEYKTFTSPEFKFSIEYPQDIEPKDYLLTYDPPYLSLMKDFSDNNPDVSDSFLTIYPNDKTLDQFIESQLAKTEGTGVKKEMGTPTDITIDGSNEGKEYSYTTLGDLILTKAVAFVHGNNIYNFEQQGRTEAFTDNQFEYMINSIKFFD